MCRLLKEKNIHLTIKNCRERCLNFICSLHEIEQVDAGIQMDLFRRNLANVEMMVYVHAFNQESWAEELNFVFGRNDKIQWMVSKTSESS